MKPFIKPALFISALCCCGYTYGDVEKTLQYTSDLDKGEKVCFSGDNSSIDIVKGNSDVVVYDVKMVYTKDSREKAEETFDKVEWTFTEGSKTQLEEKIRKHKKVKNLDIFVTITLPDNHPLDISTVNGYVKTEDDFQTDVTVKSVNGDIKWEGNIGGSLSVKNVNGYISAENIEKDCCATAVNSNITLGTIGGELETRTVNGEIKVKEAGSSISANTVNGGISLALSKETTGPVKIKSVNGDIKTGCPESLETTITARSNNGHLSCNKSLKITKMKKGKLEGTSGDGSVSLNIKSTNGNVTIETY
jgi:hypothetical protein